MTTNYLKKYAGLYELQSSPLGREVARAYTVGDLKGWDKDIARDAFKVVAGETNAYGGKIFKPLGLDGRAYDGKKCMLYDVCRKLLGHDTPNYPQQIGDCVSFGAKNATEYLQCLDILLRGVREDWHPIFPPYYYGTGRVFIGGDHSMSDGSTGAWMAAAVVKYGGLFSDFAGVPQYSGSVAKKWGYSGPPDEFVSQGKQHLIHSAAEIHSFDDLVAAINNGYACPTASNVGYSMEASSDGFHRQSTSWSHQMCFVGVGFKPEPYAVIVNNWGDCHGHLKDFDDPNFQLPVGCLRVRQKDAEKHIRAGETYAYSQFDGFPAQEIDKLLFKVVGR